MANYMCAIRSNYFSVNDPEAFLAFMKRVYGSEEDVGVWESEGKFAFGCYGGICGLRVIASDDVEECLYDDDEYDYDAFIEGLQHHLVEGDAILIAESGWEKLRYLIGGVEIITKTDSKHINMHDVAISAAAEMLGLEVWNTKYQY